MLKRTRCILLIAMLALLVAAPIAAAQEDLQLHLGGDLVAGLDEQRLSQRRRQRGPRRFADEHAVRRRER